MSHNAEMMFLILFEATILLGVWKTVAWVIRNSEEEHQTKMRREANKGLQKIITAKHDDEALEHMRHMHPDAVEEAFVRWCKTSGFAVKPVRPHNRYNGRDVIIISNGRRYCVRANKSPFGIHANKIAEFSRTCEKLKAQGMFVTVGYGSFDAQLSKMSVISDKRLVKTIRSNPKLRAQFGRTA